MVYVSLVEIEGFMKKVISIVLVVLMLCSCIFLVSSCNNKTESKLKIVTTIFPIYDWVREITKGNEDNVELTMLIDKGVDLHSYQGTVDDIVKLSSCDVFIYIGGESDKWAKNALKNATNKDMIVINLMELLGDKVKEEELIEGMEGEEPEEDDEIEYDEHIWLSLKNAKYIVEKISSKLEDIDNLNSSLYKQNSQSYIQKLDALDKQYESKLKNGTYSTVVFGDRFPFRYLIDDYGLSYYAAFLGCSAESEASFETIAFLAKKVDELGLKCIYKIESSDGKIANTIKNSSKSKNQEIVTVDSIQSTTKKDVDAGVTYLSIMESNLIAFEKGIK